jgi:cytoplasmic iron level regulating protein YaaA (DUF328/UPF0246 family)
MEDFKEWAHYLGRWARMSLKLFSPTSRFWAIISSTMTFVGGVIWLLSKLNQTKLGNIADLAFLFSSVIFWIGIGIAVFLVLFVIPYRLNRDDKVAITQFWQKQINELNNQIADISSIRVLRNTQLANLQSGASQITISVKRLLVWHSVKTQKSYAEVAFYVFNGNIFDLPSPSYQFKESFISIENNPEIPTGDLPQVSNKGGDRLGASSVVSH